MQPIHGKDCLFSIQIGGTFVPMLCATDISLSVREEIVLATSKTSGSWRRKRLRELGEWGGSLSGLSKIDDSEGQVSFFSLLGYMKSAQVIMMLFEDDAANTQSLVGTVVFPEMSIGGGVSDFLSASLSFEGDGGFVLTADVDGDGGDGICEVQTTLQYTLGLGATSITVPEITVANAEVLWVTREGTGVNLSQTNPPVGNRYFVDYATGVISFDPANPGVGGEGIEIGWQITM